MASLASRLRIKIAGALAPDDDTHLSTRMLTGLLRLSGLDIDKRAGIDRQTDWLRKRAEASGLRDRQTGELPDRAPS